VAVPPLAEPPVEPPPGNPPVVERPVREPPDAEPPDAEPPVVERPVRERPVIEPPVLEPAVDAAPVVEQAPAVEPPATPPAVTESLVRERPVAAPAAPQPALAEADAPPRVESPPAALAPRSVAEAKRSSAECLQALQAVHKVAEGLVQFRRDDLVARLRAAEARLSRSDLTTVVVGEFKKGKSSLINALAGADVCPVDELVATVTPTVVRYGTTSSAVVTLHPEGEQTGDDEGEVTLVQHEVTLAEAATFMSEPAWPATAPRADLVEVQLPSPLLQSGLTLVDTPGVGGLDSAAAQAALSALRLAEAVVFVTDATQELTAPELDYLVRVREQCPNVLCVMTKTDLFGEWRRIADLDRAHLRTRRLDVELVPVSSLLERIGRTSGDPDLVRESGFEALRAHVLSDIITPADRLAARAAARDVLYVLDQLAAQLRAEMEALTDPRKAEALVAEFEESRRVAAALREQSARWQTTLSDGIQDLSAGVEADIARRIRTVVQDGEQAIEQNDPADIWEEFEGWIRKRVVEVAVENERLLRERTNDIVGRVVEHFRQPGLALDGRDVVHLVLDELDRPLPTDQLIADTHLDGLQQRSFNNALVATRSALGGTGLLATVVHLAERLPFGGLAELGLVGAAASVVVAASVGLGRKVFGDSRRSEVASRRQKAGVVFRRYIDEASFVLAKDARESLRMTQRQLRDRFTDLAGELEQTASDAMRAADAARRAGDKARAERVPQLQAQLSQVGRVRGRVVELVAAPVAAVADA
jgi:hypothetical protein